MWAQIQDDITRLDDNPLGALNSGLDETLGPSFDYLQTIKSPKSKGVSSDGSFDQVYTNIGAVRDYVDNLVTGPKVGNRFFTETGGYCRAPGGKIVNRWTYTNNKLGGDDAAGILGTSFQNAVQGSGFDGIIPGIGGDVASMNPLKIINGLVLDGIPKCQAFTCPVTDINTGDEIGNQTHFLTPQLETNLTPCSLSPNQSEVEADTPAGTEKFVNYQRDIYPGPLKMDMPQDPMAYVLWGVAIACVFGYLAMK